MTRTTTTRSNTWTTTNNTALLTLALLLAPGCSRDNVVTLGAHDDGGPSPTSDDAAPGDDGSPTSDGLPPLTADGRADAPEPDATSPADAGVNVGDHDRCATPVPITLVGGKATIVDSTTDALDELPGVSCGAGFGSFDGAQRYFSLDMDPAQHYRITLGANFSAELYVFPGGDCSEQAINKACGSGGASGDYKHLFKDTTVSLTFAPAKAGSYRIAVDAFGAKAGDFTLTVEAVTPQTNGTCQQATPLTLDATGKASVVGSTDTFTNDLVDVTCDELYTMNGAQAYYRFTAKAGHGYELALTTDFDATLLVTQASGCSATALSGDCSSKGQSGAFILVSSKTGRLFFTPPSPGDYLVVVDTTNPTERGGYTLALAELEPPDNDDCASAEQVTLVGGKATVSGTTGLASNEHADMACGAATYAAYNGPEVYYKADFVGGTPYKLTFKPGYKSSLYLFRAASGCSAAAIDADCGSKGTSGFSSIVTLAGETEELYFVPEKSEALVFAVDGYDDGARGPFTVQIEALTPQTNATCAAAKTLSFNGDVAKASGHTAGVANEFGEAITCGKSFIQNGPQLYYRVPLKASTKKHKVTLKADFLGWVYAFPASAGCQAASIEQACAGAISLSGTLELKPQTDGDYIIVVDSDAPKAMGSFELEITRP